MTREQLDAKQIHVIGCGVSSDSLPESAKIALSDADIVAGGKRLLDVFAENKQTQIIIGANLSDTLKQLVKDSEMRNVAILASGDALFHGIAATLARFADPEQFTIHPNITAFQAICAQLKQPWSDAELFSAHGGNGALPWRRILAAKMAIVYCDDKLPASAVAARLAEKFSEASDTPAATCANLGMEDEVIHRGTLCELAKLATPGLSILVTLPSPGFSSHPPLPLGLEDGHYEHEKNLITHPETRAVILTKLGLRPGVMWDLGAGSGSVGIEAAGLCANLAVHAVEKSPERISHIKANAEFEGLSNHHAHVGNALEIMNSLPDPDIVFIGGGGKEIAEIIETTFKRLNPGGRIVASAVTLETVATLSSVLKKYLSEVVSLSVSRSKSVGDLTMMKSENQITIFTFAFPEAPANI